MLAKNMKATLLPQSWRLIIKRTVWSLSKNMEAVTQWDVISFNLCTSRPPLNRIFSLLEYEKHHVIFTFMF